MTTITDYLVPIRLADDTTGRYHDFVVRLPAAGADLAVKAGCDIGGAMVEATQGRWRLAAVEAPTRAPTSPEYRGRLAEPARRSAGAPGTATYELEPYEADLVAERAERQAARLHAAQSAPGPHEERYPPPLQPHPFRAGRAVADLCDECGLMAGTVVHFPPGLRRLRPTVEVPATPGVTVPVFFTHDGVVDVVHVITPGGLVSDVLLDPPVPVAGGDTIPLHELLRRSAALVEQTDPSAPRTEEPS